MQNILSNIKRVKEFLSNAIFWTESTVFFNSVLSVQMVLAIPYWVNCDSKHWLAVKHSKETVIQSLSLTFIQTCRSIQGFVETFIQSFCRFSLDCYSSEKYRKVFCFQINWKLFSDRFLWNYEILISSVEQSKSLCYFKREKNQTTKCFSFYLMAFVFVGDILWILVNILLKYYFQNDLQMFLTNKVIIKFVDNCVIK